MQLPGHEPRGNGFLSSGVRIPTPRSSLLLALPNVKRPFEIVMFAISNLSWRLCVSSSLPKGSSHHTISQQRPQAPHMPIFSRLHPQSHHYWQQYRRQRLTQHCKTQACLAPARLHHGRNNRGRNHTISASSHMNRHLRHNNGHHHAHQLLYRVRYLPRRRPLLRSSRN